jgi:hypothetical protein
VQSEAPAATLEMPDAPEQLSVSLDEAFQRMGVSIETRKRALQQKASQISCLLSLFDQVQQGNPKVLNSSITDLVLLHFAQS